MKTKINKLKYSDNLLNNQNYILGETEKKKLLSDFIFDSHFRKFMGIISILKTYKARLSLFILYYILAILFFIIGVLLIGKLVFLNLLLMIPIPLFFIIVGTHYFKERNEIGYERINSYKDFFLRRNRLINNYSIDDNILKKSNYAYFICVILLMAGLFVYSNHINYTLPEGASLLMLVFFLILLSLFFSQVSLFALLFAPIIFTKDLIIKIYIFVYVNILGKYKKYFFIKKYPIIGKEKTIALYKLGYANNFYYSIKRK